jgi:hypothetical protein
MEGSKKHDLNCKNQKVIDSNDKSENVHHPTFLRNTTSNGLWNVGKMSVKETLANYRWHFIRKSLMIKHP